MNSDSTDPTEARTAWPAAIAAVIGVAAAGILVWEFVVWLAELPPPLLPTPRQVCAAGWQERGALVRGTLSTLLAAVIGLVCALVIGFTIAVAFSLSRRLRMALFPYVVFLQTVPIVAIAPLLITWSGYHFRTVVIVTVIICLFPIVNSVTEGLLSSSRELQDLFRLYGASRTKRMIWLQIPGSIRHLVLGVKTSSGLAVIGAIIAEFFIGRGSGHAGLGSLMTDWQGMLRTDALIAALVASTCLGLVIFGSVRLIAETLLKRWTREAS